MEDNEYTSIKDILEMCEREGVRKVSDLTQEEIEEDARQFQEVMKNSLRSGVEEFAPWFTKMREANKHNYAAQDVLLKALKDASNHPVMESSPEVKRIADIFHRLVNYRIASLSFAPEAIFRPVIEEAGEEAKKEIKTEFGRTGGKSSKKPAQKSRALTCWNEWAGAVSPRKKHRNKTAFVNHLVEQGLCNAKTGGEWVVEFREDYPSPALEDILKKTKNR